MRVAFLRREATMAEIYRQGDVLLVRVRSRPGGRKKIRREGGRIVLAEGEVTGHAHAIADRGAELTETAEGRRFLRVLREGGVRLTHEEHHTVTLPRGTYEVRRQREYAPEAPRVVSD
jgi:hypothetical protein